MNLESFEKEIALLESQLQEAIATLRILKDVQATFQDMQPRYERLKQLTDEAAGLPDHYAKQFETARKQVEDRLKQLEAQYQQQQGHLETTLAEYQQQSDACLTLMKEQLQQQQTQWQATFSQQQQAQTGLETALTSSITELRQTLVTVDERATATHVNFKAFVNQALQDQALELRDESKQQFRIAILLALAIGAGLLILLLVK